jgi:hypothetical protein
MKRQMLCGVLVAAVAMLVAVPPAMSGEPAAKVEKPGPLPKPTILKFKYIPAESFVAALKELGHGNQLGEGLAKLPLALNAASNSVVIVAPPEAVEFLTTIAKGLDTPNEFRAARHEEELKAAEQRLKIEGDRQKAGLPPFAAAPGARAREGAPPQGPVTGLRRGPAMGWGEGRGPMMGQGLRRGPMTGWGEGRGPMMGPGNQRGPMMQQPGPRVERGPMMPRQGEGPGPMMNRGEGRGPMMGRGGREGPPPSEVEKAKPPAPAGIPGDKARPPAPSAPRIF